MKIPKIDCHVGKNFCIRNDESVLDAGVGFRELKQILDWTEVSLMVNFWAPLSLV